MVLVEELGEVAIIIRAYFWVNDHERSAMKVKSSVMRLARVAIHDAGLQTAHASFNVLFPQGMPLRRLDTQTSSAIAPGAATEPSASSLGSPQESSPSTAAEVHFKSDRSELEEQARLARNPEQGTNLLAE